MIEAYVTAIAGVKNRKSPAKNAKGVMMTGGNLKPLCRQARVLTGSEPFVCRSSIKPVLVDFTPHFTWGRSYIDKIFSKVLRVHL